MTVESDRAASVSFFVAWRTGNRIRRNDIEPRPPRGDRGPRVGRAGPGRDRAGQGMTGGRAAGPFRGSVGLAEQVEGASASLDHGLMHIDLISRKLETVVRTIKIDTVE